MDDFYGRGVNQTHNKAQNPDKKTGDGVEALLPTLKSTHSKLQLTVNTADFWETMKLTA